jgi:undecaprenyl diphosphate synthase
MLSNLYEQRLLAQIKGVPRHIALVVAEKELDSTEAYRKLSTFASWCGEIGVNQVTIYINMLDLGEEINQKLRAQIIQKVRDCLKSASITADIYSQDVAEPTRREGHSAMRISIGYGGKKELVDAIRSIALKVQNKELHANEICEDTVSSHLVFKEEPELLIRTGENRLTDFLIWQAVYSELCFTEVNWANFRKMDLLRAIRDYQNRQKRRGT